MLPGFRYETASEEDIVAYCSNPPLETTHIISLGDCSNKVIPIPCQAVVKYGPEVRIEEFNNLQEAFRLLDPSVVRVPRPYRFFQDGDSGYLIMEHIKGVIVEDPTAFHITKIGRAISHFSTFRNPRPGPLRGGISRGLLWSEGTTPEYSLNGSLQRLEHWFNRRLQHQNVGIYFQERDLVLCHLDIAPRNLLWLPDDNNTLCIVDWASAGYYPRIFEWCLLAFVEGKDGVFQGLVKKTMEPLSQWEEENWRLIAQAWGNSVHYSFPATPPSTDVPEP